jgi:hypothetical protein
MDTPKRQWKIEAKDQAGNDISNEISGEVEALIQMTRLDQIAAGRYSALFVLTLFSAFKAGRLNPFRLAGEIQALDKGEPTGLKPPSRLRHLPLKGLWHQHYMQTDIASMAMNIKHGLNLFESPLFKQKIREAEAAGEERYLSVEDVGPLVQDMVHGNWERLREVEKITGEWIVFAKHLGENYYLCLATHDKSTHSDLQRQIDALCCKEFSFLENLLSDEG